MPGTNIDRSEYYGALQQVVDQLFGEDSDAMEADPAETAAALTMADKFGISADQAALLGLAAFDEPSPEPTGPVVSRLQVVMAAEAADLPEDLQRIVNLLPPGDYTRLKLTTQLNSAITGHAWGQVYGTVS